ncbi:hypothetical protein cyc_05292 [Cyclospora cayetanensis]|uniref:Uncharacterized protein n=1 Tax=Cyclospora cayetanensis TaxID=88456 RepID=A0A1D3CUA3_9EIME|nr:hypothetical protein cyc_05292 [Cyclospora cayetanensis]
MGRQRGKGHGCQRNVFLALQLPDCVQLATQFQRTRQGEKTWHQSLGKALQRNEAQTREEDASGAVDFAADGFDASVRSVAEVLQRAERVALSCDHR